MKLTALDNGGFWSKRQIYEIETDLEIRERADLSTSDRVQRSPTDLTALHEHLQRIHPSTPLPTFPLKNPELLQAYLCFLKRHPVLGLDPQLIAFLTVPEYAQVKDFIKTESPTITVPRVEKFRLLFLGQVPIDSRFRKVERMARDFGRLKRRLKRVEGVIDVLILIGAGLKKDCEGAAQFLTALRAERVTFGKEILISGLEEARIQLQLSRFLIDGIKDVVQRLNDFRKAIHSKRLELAKVSERLERDTSGSEKPSFDVVYAEKTELDTKVEQLNSLIKSYENFADSIIIEFSRLKSSLQMSIQAVLFQIFK